MAQERGTVLSDGPKVGVGGRPSRGGSARRNRRTPEPRTTARGTKTDLRAYVCNFSGRYWLVRVCGAGLYFGEVRERIFLRLTHGEPLNCIEHVGTLHSKQGYEGGGRFAQVCAGGTFSQ